MRENKSMSVATKVSLEEYLNTSYDPDVEYVDGELVERHVGDWLHSLIQRNLVVVLTTKYPEIFAIPELRSQTRPTRYRLPDVCVLLSPPKTRYLLDAAFVAVEILSRDDRMSETMEKLEEYAAKGVPNIWLVDPNRKTVSVYTQGTLEEVSGEVLATGDGRIELTREEIFRQVSEQPRC
jgi:Uma2 family endonuclease